MKRKIDIPASIHYEDDGSVIISLYGNLLDPQFRLDIDCSKFGEWTWELYSHDDRLARSGSFADDNFSQALNSLGQIWDRING